MLVIFYLLRKYTFVLLFHFIFEFLLMLAKLTSDLNPKQRQMVMEDFRNKKKSHLVTTNLLARGWFLIL